MPNDTIGRTLGVAAGVCVICSVLVSATAVSLKPIQQRKKAEERMRYIVMAAGRLEEGKSGDIEALFAGIETRVVDLETDQFVEGIEPGSVDMVKAASDPAQSLEIPAQYDIAGIRRVSRHRLIYLTTKDGWVDRVILPVHGKGLWSTMYGFLALDGDFSTIKSLSFYEHAETPGLGGEIDNPKWKQSWAGKRAFDPSGSPAIDVVKGAARPGANDEVDGISGATLTARGVENMVHFWLGDQGYGPILEVLKAEQRQAETSRHLGNITRSLALQRSTSPGDRDG